MSLVVNMPSFCMDFWWFLYVCFQQQLLWSFIHQKIWTHMESAFPHGQARLGARLSLGHQPVAPLLFQRHLGGAPFFPLINSAGGNSWAELKRISSQDIQPFHANKTPGKICYVDDPNNVASNIQQFKIPKCLPSDSPSITRKAEVQLTIWRKQIHKSQLSNPFHKHLFSRCISQLPWTVGN